MAHPSAKSRWSVLSLWHSPFWAWAGIVIFAILALWASYIRDWTLAVVAVFLLVGAVASLRAPR